MPYRYDGASQPDYDGSEPDDDGPMPVYARRDRDDDRLWILYHAEDGEPVDYTRGDQHALVEFCMSEGYDLRDGPLDEEPARSSAAEDRANRGGW